MSGMHTVTGMPGIVYWYVVLIKAQNKMETLIKKKWNISHIYLLILGIADNIIYLSPLLVNLPNFRFLV
jgi:hypothetical protein